MFCKINMKVFKHFHVVVVSHPKVFNRRDIVEERMKFGNVKVVSNKGCDEIFSVSIKMIQSVFEISKSNRVMCRILSNVNEIKKSCDCSYTMYRHAPNKVAK